MATIGDYITEELISMKIGLGQAALNALYLKSGVSADAELSTDNIQVMEVAILVNVIPRLLLAPDKTTGDTSLKWDRNAVLSYYKIKCAEYGLPDVFAPEQSYIEDISYIH